jgi:hypothetical protein
MLNHGSMLWFSGMTSIHPCADKRTFHEFALDMATEGHCLGGHNMTTERLVQFTLFAAIAIFTVVVSLAPTVRSIDARLTRMESQLTKTDRNLQDLQHSIRLKP